MVEIYTKILVRAIMYYVCNLARKPIKTQGSVGHPVGHCIGHHQGWQWILDLSVVGSNPMCVSVKTFFF